MTNQLQESEAISFQSQPRRFFLMLGIGFGLADIIALVLLFLNDHGILHINDSLKVTWIQYVTIAIGMPVMCVYFCCLVLSQLGLGAYRMDNEGIEQTGFRKEPKYLRWKEVERVKWNKDSSCFEANGVRIEILWTFVATKDEMRAKPFLERTLSRCFDLSSTKGMKRFLAHADWRLRRKEEP